MELVELIYIFGLTNIHTFGPKISLIRLFSLMFNYAKPRLFQFEACGVLKYITNWQFAELFLIKKIPNLRWDFNS